MNKISLEGPFRIVDYSISHSVILLRKTEIIDVTPHNTDLLLGGVFYLEIPAWLEDITVEHGTEADWTYVRTRCWEETKVVDFYGRENIFVFKCGDKKYFIGANSLKVFENTYDPLETSIGMKR